MGNKRHIKKGDLVYVISGEDRGENGKVIDVFPKTERVVVEGLNMIKKHVRKNQDQPQGEIVEREGTIHWSNVMQAERYENNHKIVSATSESETSTETSTEKEE
jgi:large subunit ribosomal protein L24|tara:strand:- start:2284 stop:2595 length:312 start_codon:yes stop_codon:yes gene_type:complete